MLLTPTISRTATLSLLAAVGFVSSCAPYPLHSGMTDAQIEARLAENFSAGMSRPQVETRLDELRVPERVRLVYPRTEARPEVLLARIYPAGGFWLHDEDVTIEFVDVSFVFDDGERLVRFPIYRDRVRYFQGGPAFGPNRATMAPVGRFPGTPPPPRDPLEGIDEPAAAPNGPR